jgi:maltose alpha-D-glucosyltransferase/alpha-amylase
LAAWGELWVYWVSTTFLESYLKSAAGAGFLPDSADEVKNLLVFCTLQKALYELTYELNNRPDWVDVPIRGILDILRLTP